MTENKKPKIAVQYTPKGVAVFPRLNEPDYKFTPEGKYSLKLRLPKAEADAFLAKYQHIADEGFAQVLAEVKGKKDKKGKPIEPENDGLPFTIETNKETGEETGNVLISFGMKAKFKDKVTKEEKILKPVIVDSKGNDANVQVGGGSILKVAFKPSFYYNDATQKAGVTFYLVGVQIIKLVKFGGELAFGVEEGGYEADPTDAVMQAAAGETEQADAQNKPRGQF
jgi:hypothetical protein